MKSRISQQEAVNTSLVLLETLICEVWEGMLHIAQIPKDKVLTKRREKAAKIYRDLKKFIKILEAKNTPTELFEKLYSPNISATEYTKISEKIKDFIRAKLSKEEVAYLSSGHYNKFRDRKNLS